MERRGFRFFAGGLVLAVIIGLGAEARAGTYGYSVEQTSSYSVTGATVGSLTLFSNSSASQTASPSGNEAHGDLADALESYVGPAPGRPAENTFTPKGMVDPDYSRGDSLLSQPTLATAGVAEAFLGGNGTGTGAGAWSISAPLTLASPGAVSLGFSFTNGITLVNNTVPSGIVSADFNYNFNIQDSAGTLVFTSAPSAVNRAMSLSSIGNISSPGGGTVTITSGTLAAGTYTMTLSGSSHVFLTAVPEPSTYMLLGCGGGILSLALFRRRVK